MRTTCLRCNGARAILTNCRACPGSSGHQRVTCTNCAGSGEDYREFRGWMKPFTCGLCKGKRTILSACTTCNGQKTTQIKCPGCRGAGTVNV